MTEGSTKDVAQNITSKCLIVGQFMKNKTTAFQLSAVKIKVINLTPFVNGIIFEKNPTHY